MQQEKSSQKMIDLMTDVLATKFDLKKMDKEAKALTVKFKNQEQNETEKYDNLRKLQERTKDRVNDIQDGLKEVKIRNGYIFTAAD